MKPLTITGDQRIWLLDFALGSNATRRTEHRFRHRETGETRKELDLRIHKLADWVSEDRTVIEWEWESRR